MVLDDVVVVDSASVLDGSVGLGTSLNRSSDPELVVGAESCSDEVDVEELVGVRISRLEVVVVSPEPPPEPPEQVRPLRQQPVERQYEPD